jgi:hypothetical protein
VATSLTVYQTGTARPTSPQVIAPAATPVSREVTVALSGAGKLTVYNATLRDMTVVERSTPAPWVSRCGEVAWLT